MHEARPLSIVIADFRIHRAERRLARLTSSSDQDENRISHAQEILSEAIGTRFRLLERIGEKEEGNKERRNLSILRSK